MPPLWKSNRLVAGDSTRGTDRSTADNYLDDHHGADSAFGLGGCGRRLEACRKTRRCKTGGQAGVLERLGVRREANFASFPTWTGHPGALGILRDYLAKDSRHFASVCCRNVDQ